MPTSIKQLLTFALKLSLFFGVIFLYLGVGCGTGFRVENGKPAIVSSAPLERVVRYIPGADAETFKALDNAEDARATYAIDAKRAYIGYWGHAMPIESADPATLSIITPDGAYTKDKDRVYWFGVEIEGADPASFRIVEAPYALDANRAYAGIFPFEVRSLENFQVLQTKNRNRPIENRGNSTVVRDREEILMSGWARDGISYYWGSSELKGADYDVLTILNDLHAKDDKTVYFRGKPISGADADSFVIVGSGSIRGRDKHSEYKRGKRER